MLGAWLSALTQILPLEMAKHLVRSGTVLQWGHNEGTDDLGWSWADNDIKNSYKFQHGIKPLTDS